MKVARWVFAIALGALFVLAYWLTRTALANDGYHVHEGQPNR
jgi:hypothetical protein